MTAFLELKSGSMLNSKVIDRISTPVKDAHGVPVVTVYPREGSSVTAYASDVTSFLERPIQLLPAEPGTKLLYVGDDQDGAWVIKSPLIAWALCADGRIRPVTPTGVNDDGGEPRHGWFAEMPEGSVVAVDGVGDRAEFESVAALVDFYRPAPAKASEGGAA